MERPPSLSSTPISSPPPSSSIQPSPSSSPSGSSSRTLPLTPISQSPPSSGEYLSRTPAETTQRPPTSVSPTVSVASNTTVKPRAPGKDREALNRIREVLDGVKEQTDDLRDGQLWTTHVPDKFHQRSLPDNTEVVERLQRLEDLIIRLAEAQRHPRAPTPVESPSDSGSDISSTIRRVRERWEQEPQMPIAPATPVRPRTPLDGMTAELLRLPQPSAPPPASIIFRPDTRGPRPRSPSPTVLIGPIRPYSVPLAEPFITRDPGRRRPSSAGRLPRSSALAPSHPPETPVTRPDVGHSARTDDAGIDFLESVRQIRGRRRAAPPDGWIQSTHGDAEPAPPPPPHYQDTGRATVPAVMETRPWYPPPQPPPGPSGPGVVPEVAQSDVVPQMPRPFTQSVILPSNSNDMMVMVRENQSMHLASLEQQRELMRYVNSLNEWLGHDVEDRQAELRGVSARIDQLRDDLNRLTQGPFLHSEGSRRTYPPQQPGKPEPLHSESLTTRGEYEPPSEEPRGVPGVHPPGEEPRVAPGKAPIVPSEEPRGAPGPDVSRAPTTRAAEVSRAPTTSGVPEPETHGHIPPGSVIPSEVLYGEEPRGAPLPGVSRAPTARGVPGITPRYPSGPGALDYNDAERARQERFGNPEREMADAVQKASESEMGREHDYLKKVGEWDHQFAEKQADRDRQFEGSEARIDATLVRQPVPPGAPTPFPEDMSPEGAEFVVASIRRAFTEFAARHTDDVRDIVQGEREEMARQLQEEREETRAAHRALEQQVLVERVRADEERGARMRELEEELARARAQSDHEKQQRDHDEEIRREYGSQRILERDEETRQQLLEVPDLLLAHREEFAMKKETTDERWRENLDWRDETNRQFQDLFGMVQGVIDSCAEEEARCEEERRLAERRPSTQDVMNELQRLQQVSDSLTSSWREDTEIQHMELLDTVRSTANVQVPFNVQGYLDEFSKSFATEVRMFLSEVGRLREERRNMQFEIGTLLCLRSKYEAGGMFDPDWKPSTDSLAPQPPVDFLSEVGKLREERRTIQFEIGTLLCLQSKYEAGGMFDPDWKPIMGPLAPQPPGDLPPVPPSEPRQGAWRSVHQQGGFRHPPEALQAGPVIETSPPATPPDRAQSTGSWVTWQVQPGVEYTPPPSELSINLAPEVPQPPRGLFGPRSPRTSSHD